ncbi:TPA: hypothetical protein ACH3X1_002778 [Trebouxia sp. C0004]
MSTATAPSTGKKDTSVSVKAGNPAALSINASAGPQAGNQTEYRSMLHSQDTGTEPKQAPLPDLPVRQSHLSSTESQSTKKPVNFTSNSSFTTKQAGEAQAWVAHSDGRTNDIKAAPELKAAVPAKVEHSLSDRDAQYTDSKSPLAKDLSQAAKKGQPVAWVAHKDGRLDDIESAPVLAEALPAKVSNKLTSPAGKGRGGTGFFGKVLSGAVQVAKIAIIVGLTALATDKVQKEYLTRRERHGQDHPVKPVSDRGLLGRKV